MPISLLPVTNSSQQKLANNPQTQGEMFCGKGRERELLGSLIMAGWLREENPLGAKQENWEGGSRGGG